MKDECRGMKAGERAQAGRLFNTKTHGHVRDAHATTNEGAEFQKHVFLRNEPPSELPILQILRRMALGKWPGWFGENWHYKGPSDDASATGRKVT